MRIPNAGDGFDGNVGSLMELMILVKRDSHVVMIGHSTSIVFTLYFLGPLGTNIFDS